MSIFLRFLHSRIPTVSFPDVGTYLREKQISPKYYMKLCVREKEKKIKERRKLCKFICKEWPKAKIFGQSKKFVVVVEEHVEVGNSADWFMTSSGRHCSMNSSDRHFFMTSSGKH